MAKVVKVLEPAIAELFFAVLATNVEVSDSGIKYIQLPHTTQRVSDGYDHPSILLRAPNATHSASAILAGGAKGHRDGNAGDWQDGVRAGVDS